MTENKDFDAKINDAACKSEEIASIIHSITEEIETRDFDFKVYITGALYGVISLYEYLKGDLTGLARQDNNLSSVQKRSVIMPKEVTEAYNKYDGRGTSTPQTLQAESKFVQIYKQVTELDEDIAFELDSIVGELSRAYEKQGFEAGYKAAAG